MQTHDVLAQLHAADVQLWAADGGGLGTTHHRRRWPMSSTSRCVATRPRSSRHWTASPTPGTAVGLLPPPWHRNGCRGGGNGGRWRSSGCARRWPTSAGRSTGWDRWPCCGRTGQVAVAEAETVVPHRLVTHLAHEGMAQL